MTPCQDDKDYGGSIPLSDAMDLEGDALLAYDVSVAEPYVQAVSLKMGSVLR